MANFVHICSLLILLLVLDATTQTLCHSKGLKPKRNTWKQLGVNLTQTQQSEQQFMKWVNFVGSLKHSLFSTAKNKLFPSFTLTVDKNPATGDFTTIQQAIDSLPFVNLVRVVIKNTTPVPPPGAVGKQAVAFRISADTAAFVGCRFLGAQDTLYDHLGRHYYKECYIEGSGCHVHAIAPVTGAVTAQGRSSLLEDTGFSFLRCKVTGSGALYLGRAWGPFSTVVFAYTYMDNIIIPKGWYNWGDPNREMTVYYGQYKCSGPGATFAGRVSWSRELTYEEAKPFLSLSFIDGSEWIKL
ncbi:Pectinesterase, catalytic [Cynara cardunculus var. scolymus]|uniref:pectinesterase n=1 Tax=Cynara cardunculus var. scolymus TaxID=59895 RepID=A0A124SCH9_CYNCS|nr:Pectinesterase, catalytic [Cynara cardunculus var. scolymus]